MIGTPLPVKRQSDVPAEKKPLFTTGYLRQNPEQSRLFPWIRPYQVDEESRAGFAGFHKIDKMPGDTRAVDRQIRSFALRTELTD